jgi:oxygen-independent coproporphyrinogen III oxidase
MALGIYVHLPFCPYICPYCDFAKWPLRKTHAQRYLSALHREIECTPARGASTIFYGGGTPNAYEAPAIVALTRMLRERFPLLEERREISIEINPELVREGDFEAYVSAGINRVSIGVQSFESSEVRTLGRRHGATDIERAVDLARSAGIGSLSIDLIFGIPGQTVQSWARSLRRAIAMGADHISTYGLTIEEGTPYHDWQAREPGAFPSQDDEALLYELAIDHLEAAGYEHYEISNFARPGHACEHNRNYWANGEYIGLGVGAASYRDGVRSVHTRDFEGYVTAAEAGVSIPSQSERLTGAAALGEAIMLALRTAQGVDLAGFKERYGVDLRERYRPVVTAFTDDGFLEERDGRLALTKKGRFVANDVCGAFVTCE